MSLNFDEFQNIQQRLLKGGRLIFPDVFFQELTYMEQIVVLWKTKQNLLKAGDNITLHENEDGTVTISASQGGEEESYRIEEVTPTSGNSKAYALINATTGEQSGSTIQIPTAIKGDPGEKGDTGNGIEQVVLAEELPAGNKYRIDMTDGTFYYFTAPKGAPGEPGAPGAAGEDGIGIASVTYNSQDAQGGNVYDVNLTDGTVGGQITAPKGTAGSPGTPGTDGIGIASVTYNSQDAQGGNVYDVNLTNGTVAGQITAPKGDNGNPGTAGVGVPAGGTAGQVLAKIDGTDYNTEWITPSGGGGGSTNFYQFKQFQVSSDVNTRSVTALSQGTNTTLDTAAEMVLGPLCGILEHVLSPYNFSEWVISDASQMAYPRIKFHAGSTITNPLTYLMFDFRPILSSDLFTNSPDKPLNIHGIPAIIYDTTSPIICPGTATLQMLYTSPNQYVFRILLACNVPITAGHDYRVNFGVFLY